MNFPTQKPARERPAGGMAWAVEAKSGTPKYIGSLTREQTGLRCGCICPACDARLQAVGAGNDASKARVPFFRHHNAQQGPGCKFRVAELAALKLLAERGLIEIPAPRKTGTYVGDSGRRYEAEQLGEPIKEAIVEHRLVSAVKAILTLESGRQVVLTLRGHQEVGELGSVLAVIAIQVNDPEVAWMSPEEIIARSSLDGEWLRLVHHHDDARLLRGAEDEARKRALEQLDIRADELDLPVGATKKQASESLIHWAIKEALLSLGQLRSPEFKQTVSAAEEDGDLHTVQVFVPSAWLSISEVADEVLFDGYRPDIVCIGEAKNSILGRSKLAVEVAVSHKVTLSKLSLIKRDDIACIELDVMRFGQGGQVSLTELRRLIADDLRCKTWLHHPLISKMLVEAQLKANAARDAAAVRKQIARRQALEKERADREHRRREQLDAQARKAWAGGLSRHAALKELRQLLELRWARRVPRTSNGMTWVEGEFESATSHVLSRFELAKDLLSDLSVVRSLSEIIQASKAGAPPFDFNTHVAELSKRTFWNREPWDGLLHLVIDYCEPTIRADQADAYASQRELVLHSLQAGERRYVRSTDSDPLLADMFPELKPVFEQDVGTIRYCDQIKQKREEALSAARAVEEALAAAREAEQAAREAIAAKERELLRLPNAIKRIGHSMNWRPNLKVPASPEDAVRFLSLTGYSDTSPLTAELIKAGWKARESGVAFATWFESMTYESAEHADAACVALDRAFLIEQKHRQARG